MKEEWRQQMRQKMADYRKPAPQLSWDGIDKALAGNRQQAKVVGLWPRRIAAAIAVLLVVGAGYWLTRREDGTEQPRQPVAENRLTSPQPPVSVVEPMQEAAIVTAGRVGQRVAAELPTSEPSTVDSPTSEIPTAEQPVAEQAVKEQAVEEQAVEEQAVAKQETNELAIAEQAAAGQVVAGQHSSAPRLSSSAQSGGGLTAKVYVSNSVSDITNSSSRYAEPVHMSDPGINSGYEYGGPSDEKKEEPPFSSHDNNSAQTAIQEKTNHHLPLRLGLMLGFRLTDRWSLESGLTYTRHTSDLTTASGHLSTKSEQRLTYVGIPLTLSYQLFDNRSFSLYASGGAMAEKMVKGARQSDVGDETRVTIGPLQFSVHAALGAELKLSRLVGIYAEPSLGYYFNNGSAIPTYYQDKPLNLQLNLGLRMNLHK